MSTDNALPLLDEIERQLEWRGPNGHPQGHVVLAREPVLDFFKTVTGMIKPNTELLQRAEKTLAEQCDRANKLESIVRLLLDAIDEGSVLLDSPEIGGHDDIPPHPWHEEWIHNARAATEKTDA
jgi:hypothetical protein